MNKLAFFGLFLLVLTLPARAGEDEQKIRAVLDAQTEAWNAGDIDGFMEAYTMSDTLRFASGGTVTYGWMETLDSYKARYDTPEKMGKLTYSDLDIQVLSMDYAVVFGRWKLDREEGDLQGLFTLIMESRHEGWRIIHDHTSEDLLPFMVVEE